MNPTSLDIEIRRWILCMLRDARVVPASALARSIRTAFPHVTFPETEILRHISEAESAGLISGSIDPVFGTQWGLTPLGNSTAAQLR